jgi:hypothetical protein
MFIADANITPFHFSPIFLSTPLPSHCRLITPADARQIDVYMFIFRSGRRCRRIPARRCRRQRRRRADAAAAAFAAIAFALFWRHFFAFSLPPLADIFAIFATLRRYFHYRIADDFLRRLLPFSLLTPLPFSLPPLAFRR